MKIKQSIIYFGSGPVAAKSLALIGQSFEVEAIVTKPSTLNEMQGILSGVPVKAARNKSELDNLFMGSPFSSKLAILIDFGVIISQKVIDYFPYGIVNSHFSLLPQWRGADPITFSILSGQRITGVSLMLLNANMDEGDILAQAPYDIPEKYTTPQLTDSLIELSYQVIIKIVPAYLEGNAHAAPQIRSSIAPNKSPTYSRKLTKQDGLIDWTKTAVQLEREIRAFAGWPKSYTTLADKEVVLVEANIASEIGKPGEIIVSGKRLIVCCGKGSLDITRLKPAGKREMSAEAFLAGYQKKLI